ncbi:hypothetical protein E4U11_001722 [Claviceps purpurea]|nr:hypothetical protein E4U11_001722 [Claviceps purpurea]
MKTCHCAVNEDLKSGKCDNVYHIEALDSRAAAFEAMGDLDSATDDAEWILELAPQLPDGYLLLGRIAQLQKNGDFAWEIYTMGIEAVKEASMQSSPKLQQLYDARKAVNRHVLRQDPLCLPAELVTHIFSHLRCDEISLCLRVSKKWACTLTSPLHARLWRDTQFSDCRRNPGPEGLKRMLSWAGDGGARKVVIPENMGLTQSMLTSLLEKSPCLEYLKIGHLSSEILFPTSGKTWNRLRYFSLEEHRYGYFYEYRDVEPARLPCSFLQDVAGSLEHLDFVGIPVEWYDYESEQTSIPFLPKLKTLRINETETSCGDETGLSFPIYPLSVAFPRLEQLSIGPNILYVDPEPVSIWRDKRDDIWPHLKVLIFECSMSEVANSDIARTRSALRCLMCINHGNSLQHIGLDFGGGWPDTDIFSGSDDLLPDCDIVQDSEFKNLRSFKSTSFSICPDGARNLLSKAMQTEQLTSFDIVFPKYDDDSPVEARHDDHLRGYDWARGAPSIQSLGCYGLRLYSPPKDDQDHFVAEFLATFPNLRTLSIECEFDDIADYVKMLIEILRLTHLDTMYMRLVDDEVCSQVRQAARDQDVQLMKLCFLWDQFRRYHREWPVSLEE